MHTYLLVFAYTKNTNSYFSNKVVTLNQEFSVYDWETQEEIASKENKHTSRLIFFKEISGRCYPSESG